MKHDLKILAYDVERTPASGHVWGIWQQNIGLSQLIQPGETVSFAARWADEPKKNIVFKSTFHDGKEEMLSTLWHMMDEADAILGYNTVGFDNKHVNTEFALLGWAPPSPSAQIDLLKVVKKKFKFISNKLDFVSQQLGVGKKVSHEGFGLWLKVMEGDPKAWDRFRKYNEVDVHLLVDLYNRLLPWIDGHPNVSLHGGEGCPRCGSPKLQKRGFRQTQLGHYQRYQCTRCGAWSSSGKSESRVDVRAI